MSRNKVTDLVRNSKTDYSKNLASSLNQGNLSSKQWWKVTKQFLKQNKDSDIPILIQNGNHYSSSDDKANVLNNFFSAQSTVDDTNATLPPFEPPDTSINEIVISQEDVMDILKLLDTNKASGPDLVSPKLLKEGASVLSLHLCKLFNTSLMTSSFPFAWKSAFLCCHVGFWSFLSV